MNSFEEKLVIMENRCRAVKSTTTFTQAKKSLAHYIAHNDIEKLIAVIRKQHQALQSAKRFMNDAWDGKQSSWKFRPGWDEANDQIMHALQECEEMLR